jgi:hypothetical protein
MHSFTPQKYSMCVIYTSEGIHVKEINTCKWFGTSVIAELNNFGNSSHSTKYIIKNQFMFLSKLITPRTNMQNSKPKRPHLQSLLHSWTKSLPFHQGHVSRHCTTSISRPQFTLFPPPHNALNYTIHSHALLLSSLQCSIQGLPW